MQTGQYYDINYCADSRAAAAQDQRHTMIFIYTHKNEKYKQIEVVCRRINEPCKTIGPADLGKTVGMIISGSSGQHASVPPFYAMPEVIIFSGLSSGKMDEFLSGYRAAGITPIAIKASVTPFNLNWTLYALIEHIKKEIKA